MAELPLQMVLEQFASIARQQAEEGIRLIADAGQEVERLQSNLLSIQAQLDDAENIQAKKEAERVWLAKLKDVSYGIDDVLDEWNTKLQKMKIKEAEAAFNPLKKVCSSILHYLSCRPLVMRYDIGVKIKDLDRKLGIIAMEKTTFNFRPMTEGNKEIERPMTTSVFDLTQVYGREDDKNTIVDLLLSQGMQDLCIISIVGMGGIGKTTLAKFVFNDDKVSTRFEKKIWVCVSEPFDELRIAKAILESLTESKSDLRELETVVQKICQILDRKKFFLILDDVWTEDPNHWENLKSSLTCGSPESRILVTTRKEEAANAIGTTKIISLGTLPEGKCWLLFRRIAFSGETIKESNESKKIGEKLVQKCKGLPLAVKTLASLLRYKRTLDDWQHILDSEIWELKMVKQEVFRPLLLSYYDLPCILKKCFLYCAIFPKDYEIDIRNLIRLWMAHGYVKSKPNKDMESDMELVGKEYFETLSMRSFFQDFEKGPLEIRIRSCKMHDMVHDFAQFLTQNECYAKEVASVGGLELDSTYDSFKHSRIKIQEGASFPSSIYTRKTFLRSLMVDCNDGANPKIVLSKSVDQLAYLRSLSLYKCSIEEIPVEIKGLIHLRYLDLSGNDKIKKLPETLCELHNLQTLDISGCRALRKLPQGMGNLINMRCLLNWGTSISYMPKGLERLTCLRTLRFVISDGSYGSKACSIECLRNFEGLQDLGIKGFGNLTDAAKVKGIELINKKNLRDLIVDFEGSNNAGHDYEEFLEALQPPPNLMELSLRNYKGNTMFPNWMVSLNKLRKLTLQDCRKCEHLPPLGKLSSLEILSIWGMWRLKRVGNEFLGIENDTTSAFSSVIAFPKLKHLQFIGMRDWEEWNYDFTNRGDEDITVMSSLETLQITGALKLTSLPNHLRQMSTLKKEFIFCPLLDEQRTDNSSSSSASYQLQQ